VKKDYLLPWLNMWLSYVAFEKKNIQEIPELSPRRGPSLRLLDPVDLTAVSKYDNRMPEQ
jgi:hypothetical protein